MMLLLTTKIDREGEILFFLIDFTFVMVSNTVNDVWFLFHLASYEAQLCLFEESMEFRKHGPNHLLSLS